MSKLILEMSEIALSDLGRVGGKNASLGEMFRHLTKKGIRLLDGFATTSDAYRHFLATDRLGERIDEMLAGTDVENLRQLKACGRQIRRSIMGTPLPHDLIVAIGDAYRRLHKRCGREFTVAVRSSATAEDLPEASFAGAAETFLNVSGEAQLIEAVHKCFASIFSDRAISYRSRVGYGKTRIAVSVGVQPMVRSDLACAGVMFTLDTESGFRDVVQISSSYGLGEFVVKGAVTPDEWLVFKPTLLTGRKPIVSRRVGSKEKKLVYSTSGRATVSSTVNSNDRRQFSLADYEVLTLAKWGCIIEEHYSQLAGRPRPMDIEWAKDGQTGELFVIQARPETVHSTKPRSAVLETFEFTVKPPAPLVTGRAVGRKIAAPVTRVSCERSGASRRSGTAIFSSRLTQIPTGNRQ